MMPQWDFLDFLRDHAGRYPGFALEMNAPVRDLIEEDGRICGVRLADGSHRRGQLTLAADGRSSIVRPSRMLPLEVLGAPIDVFWFRLPRSTPGSALRVAAERGRILVTIDRGDYRQCAFVIPKGKAEELIAGGIGPVRALFIRSHRNWTSANWTKWTVSSFCGWNWTG